MHASINAANRVLDDREGAGLAAGLIAVLIWSSSFVGIDFALRSIAPLQLVWIRFAVGSVCFLVLAGCRKIATPRARDVPMLIVLGLIGQVTYQVALCSAQTRISAAAAGVLSGLIPVFTALLSMMVLSERLTRRNWAGLILSFLGAAMVSVSRSRTHFELRSLLALFAAASSAVYFVLQKPWLQRYGALDLTAYSVWTGTLTLFPIAAWDLPGSLLSSSRSTLWTAVYLGVFPTAVGYSLWAFALARSSAGRVSSLLYLEPVGTFLLAWLFLGEGVNTFLALGAVLALIGVVLVSLPDTHRALAGIG